MAVDQPCVPGTSHPSLNSFLPLCPKGPFLSVPQLTLQMVILQPCCERILLSARRVPFSTARGPLGGWIHGG